jgi:hypothetical protein
MATVIRFPTRGSFEPPSPTLREILRERGIEPTGDERRRKRREVANRRAGERQSGEQLQHSHPEGSAADDQQ